MTIRSRRQTTSSTQVQGEHPYRLVSNDYINNMHQGPLPSAMSNENVEHGPAAAASGGRRKEKFQSVTEGEVEYNEPPIPHAGSVNSSVWHTRHGGSYIELSGKHGADEFINIIHRSGTHITIDEAGSVIIKSFGDNHTVTDGNSHDMISGRKNTVAGGGYTIHVKNGVCDIRSEGNMNLSSGADMTISAAGSFQLNVGDALDLSAGRISMQSKVDTFDITSQGTMRLNSLLEAHILSDDKMNIQSKATMDIKSTGRFSLESENAIHQRSAQSFHASSDSNLNLTGGGIITGDASQIHWNSGLSTAASGADDADESIRPGIEDEPDKAVATENITLSSINGHASDSIDDPADE